MQFFAKWLKAKWKVVAAILGLAVVLELFIFNFRHFESRFFSAAVLPEMQVSEGFVPEGNGLYRRQAEGDDAMAFEFLDINAPIKNIYCGVTNVSNPDDDMLVNFEITDAAHKYYYQMPTVTVMGQIEETKYYRLHLKEDSEKLRLLFSSINHGDVIRVDSIRINVQVPLFFSLSRFLLLLCGLAGLYALRPTSGLYSISFGKTKPLTAPLLACVLVLVVANAGVFWLLSTSDPASVAGGMNQPSVYHMVAESLANGRFDLDLPVSEGLLAASSPYDHDLRVVEEIPFYWDMSFFGGKYYLYFGVTPVLLFSLPYYMATGMALPMYVISFLFCCIFVAGVFLLLNQVIRHFFDKVPFVVYLLLSMFVLYASNMVFLAKDPSVYNVSVLSGVALCVMAYGLWLLGLGKEKLRLLPLLLGSLCMALVGGCRPSLLLLGFFAVPLFWGRVFKTRELFSKRGLAPTLALTLPVVGVGAFLMFYNYVRFGSILNFGHEYLLTVTDISIHTFLPENIGRAIFYFFLQPPSFTGAFPYITPTVYSTGLLKDVFAEPMYGGVLASYPLLWCLPLLLYCKKELRQKRFYWPIWALLGAGVVLACVASQQAGLAQRYMGDFFFVVAVAGVLLLLALADLYPVGRRQGLLRVFVVAGTVCALAYAFCLVFSVPDAPHTSIKYYNPQLFFKVMRRIQFWM